MNNEYGIIVIPDPTRIIPSQEITYLKYEEKNVDGKTYQNPTLCTEKKDIEISWADGAAMHSSTVTQKVKKALELQHNPYSIQFRLIMMKGLSHEIDFHAFAAEHGITTIIDLWGTVHAIQDVQWIMTKSCYKAYPYFNETGTSTDWDAYWKAHEKYNHKIGIAKWSEPPEMQKIYTRANYQILQTLALPPDEFISMADYTKDLYSKIATGDVPYTLMFAGLKYIVDECGELLPPKTDDPYFNAVLKNPECLKDKAILRHVQGLLRKAIDEMKIGKLYMKGGFRYATPDLVAFCQWALGLPVNGCLKFGECYVR